MMRARATLGLTAVSALLTIGVSMSLRGSRFPDVRDEATLAIVFAAIAVGGALWMLIRRKTA